MIYHVLTKGMIIYMIYHFTLLEKITTCRVRTGTKKKLQYVTKCMKIEKKEPNAFYSEDYVIDKLSRVYLKLSGFDEMQNDIKEKDIEPMESYLKRNRIDTNLPPTIKDDLKGISEGMSSLKMADRKLSYIDVIERMKREFLDKYPDLKDYLLEYRYIRQQQGLKEFRKQHNVR